MVFDIAGYDDIPELIRLRIAYMIADFGSVSDDVRENMERQLPDYFERKLNKELIAFVARDEGRLLAAAYLLIVEKPASSLLPTGWSGEVLSVYTEDSYRGKGICTKLMSNLVDYGREHGLDRICLMATKDGYPVYKKVGFEDKVSHYTDMIIHLR